MITSKEFGRLNSGETVTAYTMVAKCGVSVTVLDFGGIIQSIKMPDKNGNAEDIVCGYDTPQEYIDKGGYHGAIIGRYANRIQNGEFTLNGITYHVTKNKNGQITLHGGNVGFDKKMWKVTAGVCPSCGVDRLELTLFSPDGEEGFPGNMNVKVVYRLDDNGELAIRYFASSDKDTPVAMTNHAYFNLAGYGTQNVLEHQLTVNSRQVVGVGTDMIPTEIFGVTGTAFDFRYGKKIGEDIEKDDEQLKNAGGYDHTFIVESTDMINWKHGLRLAKAAELLDTESGRKLMLYTDAPGVQIYTANFMQGVTFKGGVESKNRGAVCLETGMYPNTPNRPDFPSCIIGQGKDYQCTAVFKFSVQK